MADGYGAKARKEQYPAATLQDQQKWSQLVKRAWADETLKQRLLNDPATLLREHGIAIPADADVRVVQNKDTVACMVEPRKSAVDEAELTSSDLSGVVGGGKPKSASSGSGKAAPVKYLQYNLTELFIT